MVPVQSMLERPMVLLAADTTTINDAAVEIRLVAAAFTPGPNLTLGDVPEPTFDGYAAKTPGAAPGLESVDPVTGDVVIDFQAPVGGWRWETTGTTDLPQTIFGFVHIGPDGDLFGAELLPNPVVLDGINQSVVLPRVSYRLPAGSIS